MSESKLQSGNGETPEQALQALLSQTSLSTEEFDRRFAPLLRECQKAGECRYDWVAVRHLLALRLRNVYDEFAASDAAAASTSSPSAPSDAALSRLCAACRTQVAAAQAAGRPDPTASVHCRQGADEEEKPERQFIEMMHLLISFYKPPFTFQRMCDLLLEPRRYCKTTSKFLLAFSKLVYGINCDVSEDRLNVNWLEAKDAALGLQPAAFVTREEDEFGLGVTLAAPLATPMPAGVSAGAIITHAVLPPQTYRVGMSSAELAEAAARDAAARANLAAQPTQEQQPTAEMEAEQSNGATAMDSSD